MQVEPTLDNEFSGAPVELSQQKTAGNPPLTNTTSPLDKSQGGPSEEPLFVGIVDQPDTVPPRQAYFQSLEPDQQERYEKLVFQNLDAPDEVSPQQSQLMGQIQLGNQLASDDEYQYVSLLNNGSNSDIAETTEAKTMAEFTRNLLTVFQESLQEVMNAENGRNRQQLAFGQPILWHMQTPGRNGRPGSHGFDLVILNPTRQPSLSRPVMEIVFPHTNVLQAVNERLLREKQHQTPDKNGEGIQQPIKTLVWHSNPAHQREFIAMTANMLRENGDNNATITRKLKEIREEFTDIRAQQAPHQKTAISERLMILGESTLGLTPDQNGHWTRQAYQTLGPARYTYFPQIKAGAIQSINPQTFPVEYKGVELQGPQVQNLLLGNPVKVDGLKDTRRATPYQAILSWNLLKGQTYSREEQSEKLTTENKKEADLHQKVIGNKDTDSLHQHHQRRQEEDKKQERSERQIRAKKYGVS